MSEPLKPSLNLCRRRFCLGVLCCTSPALAKSETAPLYTCNLSFDALESTVEKSTIRPLDLVSQSFANGLIPVLADIGNFLDIKLRIFTYDDSKSYNAAFTSDESFLPPGWTDLDPRGGIILLGINFIRELEKYFGSLGAPLTAVCAHEAGHALQEKYGMNMWDKYASTPDDDYYKDRYELCADFISGYVGFHRKKEDPTFDAVLQAVTQFNKGNELPIGHGTADQRGNAVAEGFRFGRTGNTNSHDALEAGLRHVFTIKF